MLTLYANGTAYPLKCDDYYIRELDTGRDELIFNISIWDEAYPLIVEEASIQDRDEMHYLVKAIDAGADTAKVRCEIDLDEWRATLDPNYTNNSATCYDTIRGVCPSNWTVRDASGVTISRTIEGAYTPLDVAEACKEVYGITLRWDNQKRIVTIINPANYQPLGAFITRDLNLRELNYKGESKDFITRLYAYGADGLSFASINDGKPYVDDNTYSARIICGYWTDNRYTVAENLLEDAKKRLATLAVPTRSYTCSVYDLAKTNPDMYGFEDFSLFAVVTLIDDSRKTSINHQIVERWDYPYYPEKNDVVLSNSPAKVQSQITQIAQEIKNPNSSFNQQQINAIKNATEWLTNGDGYMVVRRRADGSPLDLLFLDNPDISKAVNLLRIGQSGIGFSHSGVNGPYLSAWTIDGNFVADFITSGTLDCENITVTHLTADDVDLSGDFLTRSGNFWAKLWAGVFNMGQNDGEKDQEWVGISTASSDNKNGNGVINVFTYTNGQGSVGTRIEGARIATGSLTASGPVTFNRDFCPGPGLSTLRLNWVRVNKADNTGTAWALCGE